MSTRYHERPDDESRAEKRTLLRRKRTKTADRERRTKTFHGQKHENLFNAKGPVKGPEMTPQKVSQKRTIHSAVICRPIGNVRSIVHNSIYAFDAAKL